MSYKGEWGDKTIITLTKKDERRHKNWCLHYCKNGNYCKKHGYHCVGSTHCGDYLIPPDSNGIRPREPKKEEIIKIPECKKGDKVIDLINPKMDIDLTGKIIFVRDNYFSPLRIADVIEEYPDQKYGHHLHLRFENGEETNRQRSRESNKNIFILDYPIIED